MELGHRVSAEGVPQVAGEHAGVVFRADHGRERLGGETHPGPRIQRSQVTDVFAYLHVPLLRPAAVGHTHLGFLRPCPQGHEPGQWPVGRLGVGDDALEVRGGLRQCHRGERADLAGQSSCGIGRVRPGDGHLRLVLARHSEARCHGEPANGERPAVQRVDLLHTGALQHTRVDQRTGPRQGLLGGLEEEHHRSVQLPPQPRQDLCDAERHDGVDVVPADVGHRPATPDDVLGRHRVQVRPVRDGPARTRPPQDADDAVATHPGGDGQPGFAQLPGHRAGGALLVPRRLGVPVDVPP